MPEPATALVTGAASGIGLALSALLSDRGCTVSLVDIDDHSLSDVGEHLGADRIVIGDVSDPAMWERLSSEVGAVDLLCLNAGVLSTSMGSPWEASPEEWNRVLGVNLLGVVNGLRAFVPVMIASRRPCNILITASLAGVATWPGGGPYGASKHAVLAVAEQAALGLADTEVDVTVLCPALVRSGMSEEGADPEVVAAEALNAAASGRFAVVSDGWTEAIEHRTATILSGEVPTLPAPNQI